VHDIIFTRVVVKSNHLVGMHPGAQPSFKAFSVFDDCKPTGKEGTTAENVELRINKSDVAILLLRKL